MDPCDPRALFRFRRAGGVTSFSEPLWTNYVSLLRKNLGGGSPCAPSLSSSSITRKGVPDRVVPPDPLAIWAYCRRPPPVQVYCPAVMRIQGANPITPSYLGQSAVRILLPLCILTNLRSRCGPIARTLMPPSCGANSIARPLMQICRGGANPIGGGVINKNFGLFHGCTAVLLCCCTVSSLKKCKEVP